MWLKRNIFQAIETKKHNFVLCLYTQEAFKNNLLLLSLLKYDKQFHFAIPRNWMATSLKVQKESTQVKK